MLHTTELHIVPIRKSRKGRQRVPWCENSVPIRITSSPSLKHIFRGLLTAPQTAGLRGVGPQHSPREKDCFIGGLKRGTERHCLLGGRSATQKSDGRGLRKASLSHLVRRAPEDPGATRGQPTAKPTPQLGNPTRLRPKACSSVPALPARLRAGAVRWQNVTGPRLSAPKQDPPPGAEDARGRSLPFLRPPRTHSFFWRLASPPGPAAPAQQTHQMLCLPPAGNRGAHSSARSGTSSPHPGPADGGGIWGPRSSPRPPHVAQPPRK